MDHDKSQYLIDDLIDGMLVGSSEGFIIDVNIAFCAMCGRSRESLIGKHISSFLYKKESNDETPFRFDLFLKGEIVTSERKILHQDGSFISIEMRTKMLPNGICQSFYKDISEQNNNEINLREKVAELSKLNKDKDQFIAVLAHDLRGPFNSILGFLNLLSSNIHNYDIETIEKHINIIQKVATSNFNLLEDILSWTSVKSNTLKIEPEKIKIATICDEIIENCMLISSHKNISITNFIAKELFVFGDVYMLNIILRNLISNAIKFTNNGGEIKITANQMNEEVIIAVSDNGIGVKPEIFDLLFDITEKRTTPGTENEIGTGMGLILCKEFVEMHKGKIWLESKVGYGSDFKFSIPN